MQANSTATVAAITLTLNEVDKLYRTHAHWLLNLLKYKIGDRHLAEDITHDAFIKILVTCSSEANPTIRSSPKNFLQMIAKNLFIDKIRRTIIEQNYHTYLANMQSEAADYNLENHIAAIETLTKLSKALGRCPKRAQDVFLLYYFDNFTQNDIAKRLHISLASVKRDLCQCALIAYEIEFDL